MLDPNWQERPISTSDWCPRREGGPGSVREIGSKGRTWRGVQGGGKSRWPGRVGAAAGGGGGTERKARRQSEPQGVSPGLHLCVFWFGPDSL